MDAHQLGQTLPLWGVVPFVGLLLSIAFLPLKAPHFWESHKNKGLVAFLWALPVAAYFLFRAPHELLLSVKDYASFLLLLTALFIVSGGIVLKGDLKATPEVNALFLLVGAVLANFIGTTGASMLLIRPLLKTNSERKFTKHIPIFFIFLVSNIGGLLTPLGDPPLFMGFIKGVPFFWTLRLLPIWAVMVGGTLLMFYLYDGIQYRKEECRNIIRDRQRVQPLRLTGKINFVWAAGIVAGIFLPFPVREAVLVLMAVLSLLTTRRQCRTDNCFNYNPILEVAILFAGIFVTMIPALLILNARAGQLGLSHPWQFFWTTGALSSFLDNTPTYLAFFSMAQGLGLGGPVAGIPTVLLQAVSAGAVFMGANSYIGNGPNFMVKVIAEEYKLKMPSFFGYMAYSMLFLVPLYLVVTLVFFR
ncbi:MAG TPA: sodium:proton antiporter [Candidatus Aminicenantes bacterium]|nr:sodium:proton antiporter [Candidatus Aminicenantes bacterium]HRY64268.1 sodium:proton antiporter [Candidatus Aminicenantes bacterium]HRZ71181.1 sodium:proton antiporter [Candidatus Aminicenantes bacterium]